MDKQGAPSQDGASSRSGFLRRLRNPRGPLRVMVVEGSMLPAIRPGDWLFVDPTATRWPRRGSIVVFQEPFTDVLAIKRVAGRPGDWVRFAEGWLRLAEDEAWLVGDATDDELRAAGMGAASDSRRYGPVPVTALVGRAWLRYGPLRRVGLLAGRPGAPGWRGRFGQEWTSGGRFRLLTRARGTPDSRSRTR